MSTISVSQMDIFTYTVSGEGSQTKDSKSAQKSPEFEKNYQNAATQG